MRTNIVIDDELIKEAMALGNIKTKKEAVEAGLRLFVKIKRQEQLRSLVYMGYVGCILQLPTRGQNQGGRSNI